MTSSPRTESAARPLFVALLLVLAGLVLAGGAVSARAADEAVRLHLKNGRIFEGRIVSSTTDRVTLELASATGSGGRMAFPRTMIERVESIAAREDTPEVAGTVRDTHYLLRAGGSIVGARRLVLRHVRGGGAPGWRLEETVEHFATGPHVPAVRIQRTERVDLAFRAVQIYFREIGEGSEERAGPRRYERSASGDVRGRTWDALVHERGESRRHPVALPEEGRARLGLREHLLRHRETGLARATFLDADSLAIRSVVAGYTAIDVPDRSGRLYDEFVWEEEGGTRLVSRYRSCEIIEEQVAEGVVAVPATESQVEAARGEAGRAAEEPGVQRLADAALAYRLPDATWKPLAVERPPLVSGSRQIAAAQSQVLLADLRVQWDPEGVVDAPSEDEAAQRLVVLLQGACPDLQLLGPRRRAAGLGEGAWRMDVVGTLRGERVRTAAVVVDQGQGRAVFLVACPEVAWSGAARSIEALLDSIRRL